MREAGKPLRRKSFVLSMAVLAIRVAAQTQERMPVGGVIPNPS